MPAKTNYDSKCRLFRALSLIALAISLGSFPVEAGEILARVQARQRLNCGVSDGRLGFSYQDAKGRWSGLDVDFCRAVAAAVVGDAEKVKYFPLMTAERLSRCAPMKSIYWPAIPPGRSDAKPGLAFISSARSTTTGKGSWFRAKAARKNSPT